MQQRLLGNPKVEVVWDSEVIEAVGNEGRVTSLRIRHVREPAR